MKKHNMSVEQVLNLISYFQAKFDANPSKMNAAALRIAKSNYDVK